MHAIWLTFSKNDRDYLKKIMDELAEKYQAPKFEPKVCYSLNPEEFSDMCIGSDIDSTRLFQK